MTDQDLNQPVASLNSSDCPVPPSSNTDAEQQGAQQHSPLREQQNLSSSSAYLQTRQIWDDYTQMLITAAPLKAYNCSNQTKSSSSLY